MSRYEREQSVSGWIEDNGANGDKMSGSANTDIARHRVFKIRNDNIIEARSRTNPIAYKLMTAPSRMLLVRWEAIIGP